MNKIINAIFSFGSFCENNKKASRIFFVGIMIFVLVAFVSSTLNNLVIFGNPVISSPLNTFGLAYIVASPFLIAGIWTYYREMFIRHGVIDKTESTYTGFKRIYIDK